MSPMPRGGKRVPVELRLWKRVAKRGHNECWPWTGATNSGGYGNIGVDGRTVSTHRLAFELTWGPIPPGMDVLHSCDNPPCCNPTHFYLGTDKENQNDITVRGRRNDRRGELNGSAKLTATKVREIRKLRAHGWTQQRIADKFGVKQPAIWKILSGKKWAHVA